MGTIWAFLQQLVTTTVTVAAVNFLFVWLGSHWLDGKIKSHFDRISEDYKFELKSHEQGAKIAEYAALASSLKATGDQETYRRANQLSWELFLWLPEDVYRKLGRGLKGGSSKKELVDAMVDVRSALLTDRAGNLGPNDIIVHAPNIGQKSQ